MKKNIFKFVLFSTLKKYKKKLQRTRTQGARKRLCLKKKEVDYTQPS